MSEVGEACQMVIATAKGAFVLGKVGCKVGVQCVKLINTIWLSKWKGRTFLGRLRAIKGEDMMYLNAGSEDKHELKKIEKELKAHGILFAKIVDAVCILFFALNFFRSSSNTMFITSSSFNLVEM